MKENNSENSILGFSSDSDITTNNNNLNKKNKRPKFDRIIISYEFNKNKYYIADCELNGYENKEFLLNTLHNFNNMPFFKFDSPYSPTCSERIIFLIPVIIIFLIILYLLYVLTIICTFNPLIIYIVYLCIKLVISLMKKWRKTLYERFKKKAINKIINNTNNSDYCQSHRIRFKLGLSGYWLELEKNMDDDNEMKKYILA